MDKIQITSIDHIVIRCSNPVQLMDTVSKQLDVPILIPAHDYGDFCSGIIHLGNLDIEFLRIVKENITKPYFYGIAFAVSQNIWKTTATLKALRIPHTAPIHTTITRDGQQWGWSTILLDGFLDNPIPAPYSLGILSGAANHRVFFWHSPNLLCKRLSSIALKHSIYF
ncbi:hypothetical protein RIVM261_038230 [Rivularia sp. IAM M-261]|nr:hypothetical protein RIVM261_038230 [Rivularia sp. IAM M-261]